jgi:hypothetical protein
MSDRVVGYANPGEPGDPHDTDPRDPEAKMTPTLSSTARTNTGPNYSTAVTDAIDGTAARQLAPRFDSRVENTDEYFGHQHTSSRALPDPRPLLENLTRCVIEILAGARELEQINRWVSDEVYRHLLKRVIISGRARQAKGQTVVRPSFSTGQPTVCEPRDGVVEAVIVVHGRARTRAVAIRLEGLDHRWRATAIHVL